MLPCGNIQGSILNVKKIETQICAPSSNQANLEVNEVLESINLLLQYIKRRQKKFQHRPRQPAKLSGVLMQEIR